MWSSPRNIRCCLVLPKIIRCERGRLRIIVAVLCTGNIFIFFLWLHIIRLGFRFVRCRGHNYPIWCVAESSVGMYLATGSKDLTARLWSTDREYPLQTYIGHTQDVDVSFLYFFTVLSDPSTICFLLNRKLRNRFYLENDTISMGFQQRLFVSMKQIFRVPCSESRAF